MTRTLVLTFILKIFLLGGAMAQDSPVSNALRLQNFSCRTRIFGDCSYDECLGTLKAYSQSVLILLPQQIDSYRIHFHGYKLNVFPEYDQDLVSMVEAFGIPNMLCKNNTAIIIPESRGNCSDYNRELKDGSDLQNFINSLHAATSSLLKNFPLHLSAHSGGGKVLGRMLSTTIPIEEVSIYDGIYGQETKEEIKIWYLKNKKALLLSAISTGIPYKLSNKLFEEIAGIKSPRQINIKNTPYEHLVQGHLDFLSREAGEVGKLRAHYDLVNEIWDY